MKKTRIWNVPEGYELDKEQSNERQVVFKRVENKRARTWKEYCEKMKGKNSYYFIDLDDKVKSSKFDYNPVLSEFKDKEDVEALAAFSKLLKLRKDWVGEWKPDWTNRIQQKFTIVVEANEIVDGLHTDVSCSMSFPTDEMRDEFLDTFRDLLEIAKPLL